MLGVMWLDLCRPYVLRYYVQPFLRSTSDSWNPGPFLCKTETVFCRYSNVQGSHMCLPTAHWHASLLVLNICHDFMCWGDAWCMTHCNFTAVTDIQFQIVDIFVYEIGRDEKDLVKHHKINHLQLSSVEWEQVKLFNDLLAVHCWKSFYHGTIDWL